MRRYYNVTTTVEICPEAGSNYALFPCMVLANLTKVIKWPSVLGIMDRGSYNVGPDPANMFLALAPPGYNFSAWTPSDSHSPSWWPIVSSRWVLIPSAPCKLLTHNADLYRYNSKPDEDTTAKDYFNFTSTKASDSFALTGVLNDQHVTSGYSPIQMPARYGKTESGNWTLQIQQQLSVNNSDYWYGNSAPVMNATFDDKTANLTLEATFKAIPPEDASTQDRVYGYIYFTFEGVMDSYHSDILDMDNTSLTWLRTVGFGNNTLNIGTNASGRFSPDLWCVIAMFTFIVWILWYCLDIQKVRDVYHALTTSYKSIDNVLHSNVDFVSR